MAEAREKKLTQIQTAIKTLSDIELKGDTMPYTSLNGNMYSYLSKEGDFGLRLGKEAREKFLADYDTELLTSYGAVMKEYVAVTDQVMNKPALLKKYFKLSFEYAKTLKPKATKKKKG